MLVSFEFLSAHPGGLDSHDVGGEGAGLVSADEVAATHGLGSIRLAYKVSFFLEIRDRESNSDGHSHGESFRDGHDNDRNRDDESFEKCIEVLLVPDLGRHFSSIRHGSLLIGHQVDGEDHLDDGGDEGEQGTGETDLTDDLDDGFQLNLEGSWIVLEVHGHASLSLVSGDSNGGYDGHSVSLVANSTFKEEGAWLIFSKFLVPGAKSDSLFVAGLALTGEIGFLALHVVGRDDHAISDDSHIFRDLDEITDNNIG